MHATQLVTLGHILLSGLCPVVFHHNFGDLAHKLETLKINDTKVGESVALIDFEDKQSRAKLIELCKGPDAIHRLTNRHEFEKFVDDVSKHGPDRTTIITIAADHSIDCRETIRIALPATQRFAGIRGARGIIHIYHLCYDRKDVNDTQVGETQLWLMYQRKRAPIFEISDVTLERVSRNFTSSSFIESFHYERHRVQEFENRVKFNRICSRKCRRSCVMRLEPTDTLDESQYCETISLADYSEAKSRMSSWPIGNVTAANCSDLSDDQVRMISCAQPPVPEPGLLALVIVVPLAFVHLFVYVWLAWLDDETSPEERCLAIDALLGALVLWTIELVAYLSRWPWAKPLLAEYSLAARLIDHQLQCSLVATSFLLYSNFIRPLAGKWARLLAAVFLFTEAIMSLKIISDSKYWDEEPPDNPCHWWLRYFVVLWCFVAAAAIMAPHVGKILLRREWAMFFNYIGRFAIKVLALEGLDNFLQWAGNSLRLGLGVFIWISIKITVSRPSIRVRLLTWAAYLPRKGIQLWHHLLRLWPRAGPQDSVNGSSIEHLELMAKDLMEQTTKANKPARV